MTYNFKHKMNTFLELANHRQSDRAYLDNPVEKEKLERILQAAQMAPSACNAQPWKIIVVTDPDKRLQVADATSNKVLSINHFSKQAPVQLVLVEEDANFTSKTGGLINKIHYPHLDLGIITAHLCLAAADKYNLQASHYHIGRQEIRFHRAIPLPGFRQLRN